MLDIYVNKKHQRLHPAAIAATALALVVCGYLLHSLFSSPIPAAMGVFHIGECAARCAASCHKISARSFAKCYTKLPSG